MSEQKLDLRPDSSEILKRALSAGGGFEMDFALVQAVVALREEVVELKNIVREFTTKKLLVTEAGEMGPPAPPKPRRPRKAKKAKKAKS